MESTAHLPRTHLLPDYLDRIFSHMGCQACRFRKIRIVTFSSYTFLIWLVSYIKVWMIGRMNQTLTGAVKDWPIRQRLACITYSLRCQSTLPKGIYVYTRLMPSQVTGLSRYGHAYGWFLSWIRAEDWQWIFKISRLIGGRAWMVLHGTVRIVAFIWSIRKSSRYSIIVTQSWFSDWCPLSGIVMMAHGQEVSRWAY